MPLRSINLGEVGVAERPAGDAPDVELARGRGVEPVDGVAPVHHPRADQQDVVGRVGGQGAQGGRDHRRGMAAQQVVPVDIAGVAHVAGDRVGGDAQPVVVVGDRDHPRTAVPAHLAVPGGGQAGHGRVDQQLDGVAALVGIGAVAHGQVGGELGRAEARLWILHRVFPLRVMRRHDRLHSLGHRTGPSAMKETEAMRTVVGRRLRDMGVG
jgi:hypothetical protein